VPDQAAQVCAALDALGIGYQRVDHPPVFTAEEAAEHWAALDAAHCKNLFLRNKKGDRHYLIVAPVDKPVDLGRLARELGSGRLSFGSAERLMARLGLTPGSVSPFGLLHDHDRRVELLLDADLRAASHLAFHPNINTSTLVVSREDFARFLASRGRVPRWIPL
jgi:Ala-tRNA(Pro) deacylase